MPKHNINRPVHVFKSVPWESVKNPSFLFSWSNHKEDKLNSEKIYPPTLIIGRKKTIINKIKKFFIK